MRLSKIKLNGFKSFVDATTLTFPSNLVGVVGPNGCGKSNVIDAVRWVMGESSAKHLRGSEMTDVIFNGSATRKPNDSAGVELIFTEVNLTSYPPNSEISVKRELSRNGQSQYFLNNIKCRRKDVTDLFLGTGLGARSYAIIEQGMISRVVEAKPEELRLFFEEAAGISKYKERRKETEQHIKETQANLARLDEIRNELNNQLEKLKKQAKEAEKYQELKQSEQLLKAQLLALRWNTLDISVQETEGYIQEQSTILQQDLLALQNLDSSYKQQFEARNLAQTQFNQFQAHKYTIERELQRVEQELKYAYERREQAQVDLDEAVEKYEEIKVQLDNDEAQQQHLIIEIEETEMTLETRQQAESEAEEVAITVEHQLQIWQETWEEFNYRAQTPTQRTQVERTNIQNLEQHLTQAEQRLQKLDLEASQIDISSLAHIVHSGEAELVELKSQLTQAETTLHQHHDAVLQLREVIQELAVKLQENQVVVNQLSGRLASLEALQEAALGRQATDMQAWCHVHNLQQLPQLAQQLTVETGWERAVEIVLNRALQAWCVTDLDSFTTALQQLPKGNLQLFEITENISQTDKNSVNFIPLLTKIRCAFPLDSLLSGVCVAENLAQALQQREYLKEYQSIITPQGFWIGRHWLRVEDTDEKAGMLERDKEIQQVAVKLQTLDAMVVKLTRELEQKRFNLREQEDSRTTAQQHATDLQKHYGSLQAQHSSRVTKLEHLQVQLQRVTTEQAELNVQIDRDQRKLAEARENYHHALEQMNQLADERETLTRQRDDLQQQRTRTQQTWQMARETRHQVEVSLQGLKTDKNRLQQNLRRLREQYEDLQEQREELQRSLEEYLEPIELFTDKLSELSQQDAQAEANVRHAQQTLENLDNALNSYDTQRHSLEQRTQTLRTNLEQKRLDWQKNQSFRQMIEEQLAQTEYSAITLLAELPEYADEPSWLAQIEAVEKKLQRLGSVNLAALQEYEEQLQRKQFLDVQADDLSNSLNLLDNAIKMIDRETRTRFKQTLDTVNQHLQEMFPKLFGGGQASVELNDADLLKAGVTIMARPPGKRNSTIHLLSGGEKTLTAIALVFAIFQLNPAPFCMLDEVDAPLDDSNVGRFCSLVTAMAEKVQFIFISHNKIAMEMAAQLIGVTMQEAGVSRPVPVDIATAVDMVTII
ncbi:MAG: chromosome segregation protein SMC [Thiotrichaceae bacterium]